MSPRNPEFEHSSPDQEPEAEKAHEVPKVAPAETPMEAPAPTPEAPISPEDAQAEHWLLQTAKEEVMRVAEKSPEQEEKERMETEVQRLLEVWTSPEKLGQLSALETEEDAMVSPLRKEAQKATKEIKALLKKLGKDSPMKAADLPEKLQVLGKAIGMINGGKVDHTRG